MALMGSDQAKLDQNEQARAVLDWLGTQGAQALLQQVAADRAQRADQPDIQRGQEEVQRRRDDAVHDWLNTPEAQRFLYGREDADIAMRQQGQRGPGTGAGPQVQSPRPDTAFPGQGAPRPDMGFPGMGGGYNPPPSGGHWRPHRDRMIESVLAAQTDTGFPGMGAPRPDRGFPGMGAPSPRPSQFYQGPGYGPPGARTPGGPPGGGGYGFMERAPQPQFPLTQPGSRDPRYFMGR